MTMRILSKLSAMFSFFNSQSCKHMQLFYRSANISTDLNYIFKSPNKYSQFGKETFSSDVRKINPSFENATNDTYIAIFEIYFSNNIETFDVAYLKLQEVLAIIGGILSFVTVVLENIACFFNIHYRNLEIFNELFDFNEFKYEEKVNKILNEKLNLKQLKKTNTILNNNPFEIIKENKMSSDRKMVEKCDPPFPFLNNKEISSISIENTKNQLFNNEVNKQGKFIYKTRNFE